MGDTPHEISVGEGKQISREDADLLTIEMICAQEDEITTLTARIAELVEANPDDIRILGWSVAVHNDYRIDGESFTFWLFTRDGRAVKGEGKTDAEALNEIRASIKEQGEANDKPRPGQ